MTDTHAAALDALNYISTVPTGNSTNGVVCTTYGKGQAIAALVDEQDAQIAVLQHHMQRVLLICEGVPLNAIEAEKWVKDARAALTNTAQAAADHDARIRADERERCAEALYNRSRRTDDHIDARIILSCADTIRAMGGDDA